MGYQRNLSGACCSGCATGASKCDSLGALTSGQKTAAKATGTAIGVGIGYGLGRLVAGPKGGLVGAGLSLVYSVFMWKKS
jgi:hypothetical protein